MKPRFTLRVVALLVTLLAVALGMWTNAARRQAEAVRAIERLGGYVRYGELRFPFSWLPWSEDWLGAEFVSEIEAVDFFRFDGHVTDVAAIIPHIKRLSVRRVCVLGHQAEMLPKLKAALPGVEIEMVYAVF
jgi:hypothetical protein